MREPMGGTVTERQMDRAKPDRGQAEDRDAILFFNLKIHILSHSSGADVRCQWTKTNPIPRDGTSAHLDAVTAPTQEATDLAMVTVVKQRQLTTRLVLWLSRGTRRFLQR